VNDVAWQAWVTAHHSIGCNQAHVTDAEHCRYRAAHIRTAKELTRILEEQGWRLVKAEQRAEATPLPMFGDV
jgi:uncharacterized protein (DUF1800 family)